MIPVNKVLTITALAFALTLLPARSASADPIIGVAVGGFGLSTPVGNQASDGTISFYIPLQGSGTYGVNAGTSSDLCFYPTTCTGGVLDMYLRFAPAVVGPNLLAIEAVDLDLFGANDPSYFLESVSIFDGLQTTFIDAVSDPGVIGANTGSQTLQFGVNVSSNPFYARLRFRTSFGSSTFPIPNPGRGYYQNTVETIRATITPVPEPGSLLLLCTGLIGLGAARRRFRA